MLLNDRDILYAIVDVIMFGKKSKHYFPLEDTIGEIKNDVELLHAFDVNLRSILRSRRTIETTKEFCSWMRTDGYLNFVTTQEVLTAHIARNGWDRSLFTEFLLTDSEIVALKTAIEQEKKDLASVVPIASTASNAVITSNERSVKVAHVMRNLSEYFVILAELFEGSIDNEMPF